MAVQLSLLIFNLLLPHFIFDVFPVVDKVLARDSLWLVFLWQLSLQITKDVLVLVPKHEHGAVERPQHSIAVGVNVGPVFDLKLVAEDVRLHQLLHIDSFLKQGVEVIPEQEVESKRVLVLRDVVDDQLSCHDLVIL